MQNNSTLSRRLLVKSSVFGLLSLSAAKLIYAKQPILLYPENQNSAKPHVGYPAIKSELAAEVVGLSHFDLDQLKTLVDARPELARATWDWGFGDWETAIGAAAHVGRKDIMDYLISRGARPDLFTFASLGSFKIVKSMLDFNPNLIHIDGPHGITLLQHAQNGAEENKSPEASQLIDWLEKLEEGKKTKYLSMADEAKLKYLGDYKFGDDPGDGFSIKLNRRKNLTLGKIGKNGGNLLQLDENKFTYNGAPSVTITFDVVENKVKALKIIEPDLQLFAKKVT